MRIIALLSFAIALFAGASAIADEPIPRGSYLGSCYSAKVKNDVLYAQCEHNCKEGVGCNLNNTTLNHISRCIGDVGNAYGRLTCRRWSTAPAEQPKQSQQLPDWSDVDKKQNYCHEHCKCCDAGTCADPASWCPSKSATVDPKGVYGCFNTCMSTARLLP